MEKLPKAFLLRIKTLMRNGIKYLYLIKLKKLLFLRILSNM